MTDEARMLLANAQTLLDAPDQAAGTSARLAAFLARQAVEELIDARCAELAGVHVVGASTKAKLAVLKSLDSTPTSAALIGAWHRLTGFCHHHAYELAPTVAEVREVCGAVEQHCLSVTQE